jgi:hypothetical protein
MIEAGLKNIRRVFHKHELLRLWVKIGMPVRRDEEFTCVVALPLQYAQRSSIICRG